MRIRLAVAALFALIFSFGVHAANAPLKTQRCASGSNDSHAVATQSCALSNTTSGNTVVVELSSSSTGASYTSTETLTCPANATNSHSFSEPGYTQICYVVTASSHASFTVSVTSTGTNHGPMALILKEFQGFGSVDSGSASNVAGTSLTVTTANANEYLEVFCRGYSADIAPDTTDGFSQGDGYQAVSSVSQDYKAMSENKITGAAGSYTGACTYTTSGLEQVVALAFQQSSPPLVPSVQIVQSCTFGGFTSSGMECKLHNTTAGNKIVALVTAFNYINLSNGTSTESFTCPSGAYLSTVYTQTYLAGLCYVDTASSHAAFQSNISGTTAGGGSEALSGTVFEISGLATGIDSGSEATSASTSVTYTTALNSEFTFFVALDTSSSFMVGGNSFVQGSGTNNAFIPLCCGNLGFSFYKTTTSSGSNTASYSLTGSSSAIIVTASFQEILVPSGRGPKSKITKNFPKNLPIFAIIFPRVVRRKEEDLGFKLS